MCVYVAVVVLKFPDSHVPRITIPEIANMTKTERSTEIQCLIMSWGCTSVVMIHGFAEGLCRYRYEVKRERIDGKNDHDLLCMPCKPMSRMWGSGKCVCMFRVRCPRHHPLEPSLSHA